MERTSRRAAPRTCAILCAIALAALLACAGGSAGSALALGNEGSGLQQLAEQETQTATTATTATTGSSSSESGNSHTTILLATGAAVILLCGVGFVIVRDARRVAPATETDIAEARTGRDTTVLRKRRAKAKAARAQRKRNR